VVKLAKDSDTVVDKSGNNDNIQNAILEMKKMKENNVLKNAITDYKEAEIEYYVYAQEYVKQRKDYGINGFILTTDGKDSVDLQIEEKSGKVIRYIANPKYDIFQDVSIEETLRNYIKYLELYIIDDWEYDRCMLISEKARLVAVFQKDTAHNTISIHSTDNEYIRKTFNLKN